VKMAPPCLLVEFPPGLDAKKSWPYSPTRSSSLASATTAQDAFDTTDSSSAASADERPQWSPPPLLAGTRSPGRRRKSDAWSPPGLDFVKSPGPAFASPNSGLGQQQGSAPSLDADVIAVLDAAAAKLPPSRLPPGLEMPPGLEGCATGLEDPPLPVRRTRCQTPPPSLARSNIMATSPCPAQHTSPQCAPFDQSSPSPCGHLIASPWRSPGGQQATSSNFFSTTPVPAQSFSPVPPASWGAAPITPVPPPPPTWAAGAGSPVPPQPAMWGAGPGSPVPPLPATWGGSPVPPQPATWGSGPGSPDLAAMWSNGPASPAPARPPTFSTSPGSPMPLQPAMWSTGPSSPPPQSTAWGAGPSSPGPPLWSAGPGSPIPPPPMWAAESISPSKGQRGQPLCPPPAAPAPRSLEVLSPDTAWLKEDVSEVLPGHRAKPLKVYIENADLECEVTALDPCMPAKKSVPEWL